MFAIRRSRARGRCCPRERLIRHTCLRALSLVSLSPLAGFRTDRNRERLSDGLAPCAERFAPMPVQETPSKQPPKQERMGRPTQKVTPQNSEPLAALCMRRRFTTYSDSQDQQDFTNTGCSTMLSRSTGILSTPLLSSTMSNSTLALITYARLK